MIRRVHPQLVVAPSPERNLARIYASHPDHLATGEAAIAAVYPDARNPFAHAELLDEGYEPHIVEEMWLTGHASPDHVLDITATLDRKIAALRCHESQIADPDALEAMVRAWAFDFARSAGLPDGRAAEGFRVVVTT